MGLVSLVPRLRIADPPYLISAICRPEFSRNEMHTWTNGKKPTFPFTRWSPGFSRKGETA